VTERALFDADVIRALARRTAFVRTVERPTLVLGSTQDVGIVDTQALARRGVELVRRRSGGGAVLLEPDRAVWVDTWVPRGDPLWRDDVARSGAWIGAWWAESLGVPGLQVHDGRPIESRWSDRICFAGLGAQWRSSAGALIHSLAYLEIEWERLTELLDLGSDRALAAVELTASTITVPELVATDAGRLTSALLARLPDPSSWEVRPGPG
jgi:lipoate-protein ligase A